MTNRKSLTIILFIQALEDQPQFFLMILEIMNKLLKVQLPIQVLVSSFHNFLFRRHQNNLSSLFIQIYLPPSSFFKTPLYATLR